MEKDDKPHRKGIIGNPSGSFWLYDSKHGFDLTHPKTPSADTCTSAIEIQTTDLPIKIDPAKSALLIIDMQNMFLSTEIGRSPDANGLKVQQKLLQHAIPAARKASIRIIWINWGVTQEEIDTMPPASLRIFGVETYAAEKFDTNHLPQSKSSEIEAFGKNKRVYVALGKDVGPVKLRDGSTVDGGGLLMRDAWNSQLTPELDAEYQKGLSANPPDVWIHKNRMSALWGATTDTTDFLDREGIRTLFFAGVNADQCVFGSFQDAYYRGYDCVLLKDGTGSTSPSFAQQCVEFNAANFGFVTDCETLSKSVDQARRRGKVS